MAKADSLITLRGSHGGITFVKSPTYGDHVRAARGTHKKAKVNAAFKKQSKKLVKANHPAQILRNAIDPYRNDSVMVSCGRISCRWPIMPWERMESLISPA